MKGIILLLTSWRGHGRWRRRCWINFWVSRDTTVCDPCSLLPPPTVRWSLKCWHYIHKLYSVSILLNEPHGNEDAISSNMVLYRCPGCFFFCLFYLTTTYCVRVRLTQLLRDMDLWRTRLIPEPSMFPWKRLKSYRLLPSLGWWLPNPQYFSAYKYILNLAIFLGE